MRAGRGGCAPPSPQRGVRRGRPAGPGSLAARPDKQAGKCVYKLFKLWINFSGVCVCVSPPVVIFQKSGLLEIFSLKLERNLNSLRAGGARGGGPGAAALAGLLGFPLAGPRTDGARSSAAAQREEGERRRRRGWCRDEHLCRSLSIKAHRAGPGARHIPGRCRPSPAGTGAPEGGEGVFPGSPGGGRGFPPRRGARGEMRWPREGRRRRAVPAAGG